MGRPVYPDPVKLFAGLLSASEPLLITARERLVALFGRIDYESALIPFTASSYYRDEMGEGLLRQFIGFERLVTPEGIAHAKIETNGLEEILSSEGKRRVNIDPGYIELSKMVLLTTKNRAHRIYIAEGIYGEITLTFRNGTFEPREDTYPDYRSDAYRSILNGMRATYKERLGSVHQT